MAAGLQDGTYFLIAARWGAAVDFRWLTRRGPRAVPVDGIGNIGPAVIRA